ncbi:MAG: quinohemoprotein amine dehydrogenase subunit alpha [Candidatus Binataceae bacterium]
MRSAERSLQDADGESRFQASRGIRRKNETHTAQWLVRALAALLILILSSTSASASETNVQALAPQKILERRCAPCHQRLPDGGYSRISRIRAVPEAWDMTIIRMRRVQHARVSPTEQAQLVKYLADSQGLAPDEAAPYRYILERRPNYIEQIPNAQLGLVCGSCHSLGRVGLERRPADEWLKLADFHLGQFPSIEYHSRLRSVQWWEIASTQMPAELEKRFPFDSAAWKRWSEHKSADLSGEWRVTGHEPGAGDYRGALVIAKSDGDDRYSVHWRLNFERGKSIRGDGSAILYTGYEWRASTTLDGKAVRQVLAVAPDGESMTGRWYYTETDERGGEMRAVRIKAGTSQVLAVQPSSIRAGAKARLTIAGINLNGDLRLGDGIKVVENVSQGPGEIVVIAQADENAADGIRDISVGDVSGKSLLVVYHRLDSLRVEPDYAIARVGGNGGPIPPVTAQFEAIGYLNGPDGKAGTPDDIRVGVVAAKWSVAPFDETAAAMQDVKFAGKMDANGLFMPAGAGPNPKRRFGTNNTGNLKVLARVEDQNKPLSANAQLIVTVQRWVDPPLR